MSLVIQDDGTQIADFEFGFTLDKKAQVEPQDDGSLIIEGLAADFGLDRQDEAFEPGAFEEGLKSFMDSNPILLYHHKPDTALGRVIDAVLRPDGLHVKALVDAPEPGTVVADYVNKIKNGTIRAFSVGGRFFRRMTANGPRIFKCDLRELSVTPLAVNPRTLFQVAGKAFESAPSVDSELMSDFEDRLKKIDELFDEIEGKAQLGTVTPKNNRANPNIGQGHPDRAAVGALLMHVVKVHTLAENTAQNASDPEVEKVANAAAASAKKHSSVLHQIAARIGPLPEYYGPLT